MTRFALPLLTSMIGPLTSGAQPDLQGHRGCRGLRPENTIPAFLYALDLGIRTLELDVVITADRQVLVSHEPWMNPEICLGPGGNSLRGKTRANIYRMTLDEVREYDCGSLRNSRFPQQVPASAGKPTLEDVFQAVSVWQSSHPGHTVRFNIEIKHQGEWEHRYCPEVPEFCTLVLQVIRKSPFAGECLLQSFSRPVLSWLHATASEFPLAYLTDRGTLARNLKKLGFVTEVYSPDKRLVSREMIDLAHQQGLKVIPWTVNDPEEMTRLLDWGADGLISDYPDRLLSLERP